MFCLGGWTTSGHDHAVVVSCSVPLITVTCTSWLQFRRSCPHCCSSRICGFARGRLTLQWVQWLCHHRNSVILINLSIIASSLISEVSSARHASLSEVWMLSFVISKRSFVSARAQCRGSLLVWASTTPLRERNLLAIFICRRPNLSGHWIYRKIQCQWRNLPVNSVSVAEFTGKFR